MSHFQNNQNNFENVTLKIDRSIQLNSNCLDIIQIKFHADLIVWFYSFFYIKQFLYLIFIIINLKRIFRNKFFIQHPTKKEELKLKT